MYNVRNLSHAGEDLVHIQSRKLTKRAPNVRPLEFKSMLLDPDTCNIEEDNDKYANKNYFKADRHKNRNSQIASYITGHNRTNKAAVSENPGSTKNTCTPQILFDQGISLM